MAAGRMAEQPVYEQPGEQPCQKCGEVTYRNTVMVGNRLAAWVCPPCAQQLARAIAKWVACAVQEAL